MKQELLHDRVFSSIAEAQQALDVWVRGYNQTREHQSLGNRPPAERSRRGHSPRRLDDSPEPETVSPGAESPGPLRRGYCAGCSSTGR